MEDKSFQATITAIIKTSVNLVFGKLQEQVTSIDDRLTAIEAKIEQAKQRRA